MKQCVNGENLHLRLKKIIGQVQAIDRMVDEDILFRINEASLYRVRGSVSENMFACVPVV